MVHTCLMSYNTFILNNPWYWLYFDGCKENVDTAFKGAKLRGQNFLSVYHNSTRWVSRHNENSNSFDSATFKSIIKFLVDNAYFCFGEWVMRQIIGIPMGLPPAPPNGQWYPT